VIAGVVGDAQVDLVQVALGVIQTGLTPGSNPSAKQRFITGRGEQDTDRAMRYRACRQTRSRLRPTEPRRLRGNEAIRVGLASAPDPRVVGLRVGQWSRLSAPRRQDARYARGDQRGASKRDGHADAAVRHQAEVGANDRPRRALGMGQQLIVQSQSRPGRRLGYDRNIAGSRNDPGRFVQRSSIPRPPS